MSVVKLGSSDENYFKNYERKFIQLNRDDVMLIHLFSKDIEHSFEDIWLHDLTGVYEKDALLFKESAKQLIDQLEGHWCRAFLEALRDECNKRIEEDLRFVNSKVKQNENL